MMFPTIVVKEMIPATIPMRAALTCSKGRGDTFEIVELANVAFPVMIVALRESSNRNC